MLNRYPLWKNILIFGVIVLCTILALPNLFGEDPSIQISPTRDTQINSELVARVDSVLKENHFDVKRIEESQDQILIRFKDTEEQLKAKDLLDGVLQDQYLTALNLAPDMPEWLSSLGLQPMYLGLDLRGGVHFLLEIDMEGLITQLTNTYAESIRSHLSDKGLTPLIDITDPQTITLSFGNANEANRARQLLTTNQAFLELSFDSSGNRVIAKISNKEINERKANAVVQNITTLRNRVNELGVAEPIIQQQGLDRIVVQLPGIQDTTRAKEILGTTATLEFRIVDDRSATEAYKALETGRAPLGTKLYLTRDGVPYLLKRQVILTGDSIVKATAGLNHETNLPEVYITLDSKGADRFAEGTKANVKKPMATVFIENKLQTTFDKDGNEIRKSITTEEIANVATIQQQLFSNFSISGINSLQEANNLAITLSSGALAAPIHIIEERTIGPSAGKENVQRGVDASLYGLLMVMVFMILRYRGFGMVANVALLANLVLILAVLSLLQATLTLPGIAGIVLSLGMSVDANVLINERIREDLRRGNTPQQAINNGFGKAFGTIMDANLTSLFSAIALFFIGSGPIKGFAVTLSVGIITSVFTAVYFNRAIINLLYGSRRTIKKLSIGGRERLHIFSGETTYNFMRYAKVWIGACVVVCILAVGISVTKGFKLGLDFTGGTEIEAVYEKPVEIDTVREQLEAIGFDSVVAQHFGSARNVLINIPTTEDIETSTTITEDLTQALTLPDNPMTIQKIDYIGAKVGSELVSDGVMASALAIFLILVYIWFRFEWKLSVGTILSTVHDGLFVVAAFSILGLEFDLTSLAAILAVIGYSVNDTVVILDRIRENFRLNRTDSSKEIINTSINQTLSRTVMTSLTTFLAVLALYIFGGEVIHSFSLIMLIGIVIATYSSIFIAAAGAYVLGLKREDLIPPPVAKEDGIVIDEGDSQSQSTLP
ncbi:protein translocase subunit SecD [Ignatzschineria cameli]|uniref:Multifunctional fusion protein n=1 Tax=Ignatzschineria cameli TaxID=2182793 RepID=A0A2U2AKF9_9GAMM|nr:protein translocase subunit SecD [Ignatzschineria cameli]PWD83346.1 protein translocase subunit SecDF [Ignatzschineria cameli]PWD88372.1 protein translocase subunit SecDF [Ignatzschineria cameli]PWD88831.1 protein translocase subunit SecDF [Ignatzschineria cameli]PWD89338.1 protein translocase subunit SecDF [Ignatzschineria cameli]